MSGKGVIQIVRDAFWNPHYEAQQKQERGQSFSFDSFKQFAAWLGSNGKDEDSGLTITEENSLRLDTVFSCINVLAQDIATIESPVKQIIEGERRILKRNSVHQLLNQRVNPYMSAYTWKYLMVSHVLGRGNGYTGILRDGVGNPSQLIPLMPWDVQVLVLNEEVTYHWMGHPVNPRDILHFKLYTLDGIEGISSILWNKKLAGYKIKQDKYSTVSIGTKPPGFISGEATSDQLDTFAKGWKEHMSGSNADGIPLTSGQFKYNPLMITPEEAQHLETKQYTDTKICGIFRVPLAKISNIRDLKYSNSEQVATDYVVDGLSPIAEMMKQEIDYKLFSERNKMLEDRPEVVFNVWSRVRGDFQTRSEDDKTGLMNGSLTPDEWRARRDMSPLPGNVGDKPYTQAHNKELGKEEDNGGEKIPA